MYIKVLCNKDFFSSCYRFVWDQSLNDFTKDYRLFIKGKYYDVTIHDNGKFSFMGEDYKLMKSHDNYKKDYFGNFLLIKETVRNEKLNNILNEN